MKVDRVVKCQNALCKLCAHVDTKETIEGSLRGRHYTTTSFKRTTMMVACTQSWVVYVVTCWGCGAQYVGRTEVRLNRRFGGHRANKKKKQDEELFAKESRYFREHFGKGECREDEMKVQIVEQIEGPKIEKKENESKKRKKKENKN